MRIATRHAVRRVQRACLQLAGKRTDADCSQYMSQTRSAATAEGGRGANTKRASAAAAVRSLSWVTAIRLHNECNQPGEGRRGPARLERPIMGSARPSSARSARSGPRGRRPRPSQGRPRPRSLSPLPETVQAGQGPYRNRHDALFVSWRAPNQIRSISGLLWPCSISSAGRRVESSATPMRLCSRVTAGCGQ